ncbi:hypothetical protein BJ165DRAFT_1359432, partial [Panaeolus papilionaceus]
ASHIRIKSNLFGVKCGVQTKKINKFAPIRQPSCNHHDLAFQFKSFTRCLNAQNSDIVFQASNVWVASCCGITANLVLLGVRITF